MCHVACRAQEFKALQQHIDDLTEEKFMLQVGWLPGGPWVHVWVVWGRAHALQERWSGFNAIFRADGT